MKSDPRALLFWIVSCSLLTSSAAYSDGNLVRNGSFETVENGKPSHWTMEGDAGVTQTLSVDAGVTGGRSAKLDCTAFERETRDSYATLAQNGFTGIKGGKWYRFSCWGRQEGMASGMATVELYGDMGASAPYTTGALFMQLALRNEWRRFERYFKPGEDCTERARLSFYFDFTGAMWLDDVEIVEVPAPSFLFTSVVPRMASPNLLPNSSFECGGYNWSSLGKRTSFAGGLTGLYGTVQRGEAADGAHCLRVDLGPGKTPLSTFNCRVAVVKQDAPLAASLGWIETAVGESYTLSAYLRASKPGVPAKLLMRYGAPNEGNLDRHEMVVLDTTWKRYSFTCRAEKPYVFAAVGPDLSSYTDSEATVWVDAIMMEQAEDATEFTAREPLELGLTTDRYGNVFSAPDPAVLRVSTANRTSVTSTVVVHVTISDFFDDVVSTRSKRIEAPAESAETIDWDLGLDNLGFYRVVAMWEVNGELHRKTLRIARIESYAHDDSVFGMNHAPSTNEMCRHMRKAGSVYAREWAMEWEDIEPQPGNFTFDKADAHVNRVLSTGMRNVQQLPPFPSVSWNSEAPEGESVDVPHVWWHPAYYAPKDVSLFVRYADTVVRHFKDRIQVWEYLNEPFYTIHALPNVQQMDAAVPALVNAEYTVEDYIALLRVFYETVKKADPTALTIGGMGGRPDLLTKEFFQAGGLDYLDIFNLHIYPGLRKPEGYVSQMAELLADMSKTKAGQKPIWITEASYYGVDELPHEPYIMPPGPWAANRLLRDERESADYATRFNLIMLAHGVEKVFYHWGGVACADPNAAGTLVESWMTDFAGTPRKLYVAQSVLANLLGPNPRLAATLKKPPVVNGVGTQGVYGYAFQCGGRGLLAAWAPSDENPDASWFLKTPAQAQIVSIVGVELPNETVALGDSPVYVVSSAMPASEIASACKLHRASMS